MSRTSRGSSGSPRPAAVPVSMRGARTLDSAVPLANCQVHPLVFQILFRVPSLSLPPVPFRDQAACQGFVPRATLPGASTHLEDSQVLDTFRPQVLSTSRRLSPRSGSTGLFHPAAASRAFMLVQGLTFSTQPLLPHRKRVPPCRCSPAARQHKSGGHAR